MTIVDLGSSYARPVSKRWIVEADRKVFELGDAETFLQHFDEWLEGAAGPLTISRKMNDHIRFDFAETDSLGASDAEIRAAALDWIDDQASVGKHSYNLICWTDAAEIRNRLVPLPAHGGYELVSEGPDFKIVGRETKQIGRIVRTNRSWRGFDDVTKRDGSALEPIEAASVESALLEVLHEGGWCVEAH